jgi:hypothetical protein
VGYFYPKFGSNRKKAVAMRRADDLGSGMATAMIRRIVS